MDGWWMDGMPQVGWDTSAAGGFLQGHCPPCPLKLWLVWLTRSPGYAENTLCSSLPRWNPRRRGRVGWEEAELISHSVCKYCPAALGTPQQWHHTLHVNETSETVGLHCTLLPIYFVHWIDICAEVILSKPAASSAFPAGAARAVPQSRTSPERPTMLAPQIYYVLVRL